MAGRGRGESSNVEIVDTIAPTAEDKERTKALARQLGISETEVAVRGRGGFRQPELRTIPPNIEKTKADLQNTRQLDIVANYVPINTTKDSVLQKYRVDFVPEIESLSLMRYLFRSAARQKFSRLPMYDGVHECRSGQILSSKVTTVDITENNGDSKTYQVIFTHTGVTAMGNEMVRTYNIHMKEFFRILGYYQPQPGLHVNPNLSNPVGNEIMMLRGFRTAANIHDENRILMNFEGSHKLVQKKNVLDIMRDVRSNSRGDFREAIRTALIGKLVVTNYNKRAYRVEDVDFNQNPNSSFSSKDGSQIVYADYFRNAHNCAIRDVAQPLLTVVPNNNRRRGDEEKDHEIKLVPELCNIAGLTESQRNDNRLKMDLIRASQIPPQERVDQLKEFLRNLHSNAEIQQQLSSWGYTYAAEPLKLKGYIIPPTQIGSAGNQMRPVAVETGDFQVRSLSVVPPIAKMAIIIGRGELPQKARIMQVLKTGFDSVQLVVQNVQAHDITEGDQASHFVRKIKSLDKSVTLAVVVLRNQNKAIYDAVKKAASTEMGLVTQVVTSRLICDERKSRSAAVKIAIQIAAKVGGEPWYADIPLRGAMVCGYDTYHDTASRGRSFGAFMASLNARYSRWFSKADQHDKLDEMSTQVATNMIEALNVYKQFNQNKLPERVIIYRDGVGEGQLEHVFKTELRAIEEKVKSVDPKIRLVMIIVNKRIGARFYMRSQNEKFINPMPGTVIDHGPTRANRYDFYLISQSTRQGTITPTYYNIIHDEAGFGPDIHQKMALKFCFLYYNWSGSVRVPAPCQYAHKLALLCGEHLHSQPNANLNTKLHFL